MSELHRNLPRHEYIGLGEYVGPGTDFPGNQVGGIATKSVTPVERIARTLNEARELSSRVRVIVDNLVGSRPENESTGKEGRPIGGGTRQHARQ